MGKRVITGLRKILVAAAAIIIMPALPIFAQEANIDSLFKAIIDHNAKGMELVKKGDKKEGIKEFTLAVNAQNDYDYYLGKRDSTIKIFEDLSAKNPNSPVYYYIMGSMVNVMKRDSAGQAECIKYLRKSVEVEPEFGEGYSYLALMASSANNFEEALKYNYKAVECDSGKLKNYYRISSILEKLKKYEDADNWLEKILQKDSSSYYSVLTLQKRAEKKSSFKEKYDLYFKALRLAKEEDKESAIHSIMYFLSSNAPDSAIAFCRRIIKSNYGKERGMRVRALEMIFTNMKNVDKKSIPSFAEENYKTDDPRLLTEIARYYADSLKNDDLSLKYYLKAYEITSPETVENTIASGGGSNKKEFLTKSANQFKKGSIAVSIGKEYYDLKDYVNAEKYLRESIEENEKSKSNYPHQYLGYTLIELGRKEEAVKWLSKALAMKSIPECEVKFKKLVVELNLSKTAEQLVREERMKNAKPAKDFTLADLNGNKVQLSQLKGKVVMIDFWGTWCGPCVGELPHLVKLYEKYKNNPNVIFYGIDIDEQPPVIKKFMEEKGYSFNVLIGSGSNVQKDYNVTAVPTKFLIDKQGKIQFSHQGYSPKSDVVEELSKEIDELLNLEN